MTDAAALAASLLAADSIDDTHFFEATALLATRFDRYSTHGDLRADAPAPSVLFDWLAHARRRVPDLRVWNLSCQIIGFFDVDAGVYLPHSWPWDTRDRALALTELLRDEREWLPVFADALTAPNANSIRALTCCAAELLGADPYATVWSYLTEHVDQGTVWALAGPLVDSQRLSEYLQLARHTLMPDHGEHDAIWQHTRRVSRCAVWGEVLRLLRTFPGEGIDLVEAAMRTPDVGLRIQAIDLLGFAWNGTPIPPDTINLARELAEHETDPVARQRFHHWLGFAHQ